MGLEGIQDSWIHGGTGLTRDGSSLMTGTTHGVRSNLPTLPLELKSLRMLKLVVGGTFG